MTICLPLRRKPVGIVGLGAALVLLSACSSADRSSEAPTESSTRGKARLAIATDRGVTVLDAASMDPVGGADLQGFLRLNSAGDGEHVFVTTANGFEVLATGASSGGGPALTGAVFQAGKAGHVVLHEGRTVLFDDATGSSWAFDSDTLTKSEALPEGIKKTTSPTAHHGVAIELADGTMLSTIGDEESRVGVRHISSDGTEITRNETCPGVHGEGAVDGERVVFGCEDGALLFKDGGFTKLDSPDEFGRIGNAYVTDESPIAIMDYKDDPDAEGSLLHRMAVIDTTAETLKVVDLPKDVEYTWQGVERAADGSAWFIGTDGALHQVEGVNGVVVKSISVIEAWQGPKEWQDPHPYLAVNGGTGYVMEPSTKTIYAVDLETGTVMEKATIESIPNEMAIMG